MKQEPACERLYFDNGFIAREFWLLNGKYHNENGPAIIRYYESGVVEGKNWWSNGKLHNENGPAFIIYDERGGVKAQLYFLNDKEATEEEVKRYKLVKELAGVK